MEVFVDNRTICLSGGVYDENCGSINFELLKLINRDNENDKLMKEFERKPISLYINSRGGSVWGAFGVVDTIINSKTPINTYCAGGAASAGALFLLAGHKRYCTKNSIIMIHSIAQWQCGGQVESLIENVEELKREQVMINNYIVSRSKITREKLEDIQSHKLDWYISAEQALELGIVDEIL